MAVSLARALRPYAGETLCGDAMGIWQQDSKLVFALVDGLGHGPAAAEAAQLAINCIASNLTGCCSDIMTACDSELNRSRGASVSLAIIDHEQSILEIATVGNVRAVLVTADRSYRFGASRGIVGAGFAALRPEIRQLREGDCLALFSDGIDEFVDIARYLSAGIELTDALASTILERWGRQDDDAALLMLRFVPGALACP